MPWFWETKVETNNITNSQKVINLKALKFEELWEVYPKDEINHSGIFIKSVGFVEDGYSNHCAINVSEAFLKLDIKMKSVSRTRKCDGACNRPKQHVVSAQDLANWLLKKPFPNCPKVQKFTGKNFEENIDGKTGIIFFKDYWQRKNEKGTSRRSGDHIDLWDGRGLNKLASHNMLKSILRLTLEFSYEGSWSDFEKSKEVWFWEIK